MNFKIFVLATLLLTGIANCVKSRAEGVNDFQQRLQQILYDNCAAKWGMGTLEEIHNTATCVCRINSGLQLGVYTLTQVSPSEVLIEKAQADSEGLGAVRYASEDDLLDDML